MASLHASLSTAACYFVIVASSDPRPNIFDFFLMTSSVGAVNVLV
jgi:hypothetical protein